jgi:23S rRNA (adenine2503-C2)-methyltransferase
MDNILAELSEKEPKTGKEILVGKATAEITKLLTDCGQPAYRGQQVAGWIYRRGAISFGDMTDLPVSLRSELQEKFTLGLPELRHRDAAPDGTIKYLLAFPDGLTVESVYLPYQQRVSVCLSTQVGCPAGCTFCATGQGGFARNLTCAEIVGQLLFMQRESERRISHAVYMGMGEPLFNFENVVASLKVIGSEVGISLRNLTVSTVGVVPGIEALANSDLPVTLALSLHAPDDDLRQQLIPTGRKWNISEIMRACRYYTRQTRRNLTFEYLLIGGVNDSVEQARKLATLLNTWRLPGNVNLIPFNYVETTSGFKRPTPEAIKLFREELEKTGRVTTQRMTRGNVIAAACGQLRRKAGEVQQFDIRLEPVGSPAAE